MDDEMEEFPYEPIENDQFCIRCCPIYLDIVLKGAVANINTMSSQPNEIEALNDDVTNDHTVGTSSNSPERAKKRGQYRRYTPEQIDLLWKNYVNLGMSVSVAAAKSNMPRSTAQNILNNIDENGHFVDKKRGRKASKFTAEHTQFMVDYLDNENNVSTQDLRNALQSSFPDMRNPSESALIAQIAKQTSFSLKRNHRYPPSPHNSDPVRLARRDFIASLVNDNIAYDQNCIFIDEATFNITVHKGRSRARGGRPPIINACQKGRSITVYAAISHRGVELVSHHQAIQGNGAGETDHFALFLIKLMDHLQMTNVNGWNLVFDEAFVRYKELVEMHNFNCILLPPYSPFLNPIEPFFTKLRNGIPRHPPDEEDSIFPRLIAAGYAISKEDCQGFISQAIALFPLCSHLEEVML